MKQMMWNHWKGSDEKILLLRLSETDAWKPYTDPAFKIVYESDFTIGAMGANSNPIPSSKGFKTMQKALKMGFAFVPTPQDSM